MDFKNVTVRTKLLIYYTSKSLTLKKNEDSRVRTPHLDACCISVAFWIFKSKGSAWQPRSLNFQESAEKTDWSSWQFSFNNVKRSNGHYLASIICHCCYCYGIVCSMALCSALLHHCCAFTHRINIALKWVSNLLCLK